MYKPRKNSPTPAAPQHRLTLSQYPKVCCSGIPELQRDGLLGDQIKPSRFVGQLRQSKKKPPDSGRTVAPSQIKEVAAGCLVVGDKAGPQWTHRAGLANGLLIGG
jgi:hypothetical protein